MKHVIIGYKWRQERTEEQWLFLLEKKLREQDFVVTITKIDEWPLKSTQWIQELQNIHSIDDSNVFIVPKDPGCLSLLLYLERLASTPALSSGMLVAGSLSKNTVDGTYNPYQLNSSHSLSQTQDSSNLPSSLLIEQTINMIDASIVVLYSTSLALSSISLRLT